jgi:hypothetical protein
MWMSQYEAQAVTIAVLLHPHADPSVPFIVAKPPLTNDTHARLTYD